MRGIPRSIVVAVAIGIVAMLSVPAFAATGDIIARLGPGGSPQWSPDGKFIAFIYKGGLYVTPADGEGARSKVADFSGRNYVWASDTELVYLEKPQRRSDTSLFMSVVFQRDVSPSGKCVGIKNIAAPAMRAVAVDDQLNRERMFGPVRLVDGAVGYFAAKGSLESPARFVLLSGSKPLTARESHWPRVQVLRKGHRYSPGWGYLCLTSVSRWDALCQPLTADESFGFPVLSPAGDKVIALSLHRQAYVVIDTLGKEVTPRFEPQGKVQATGLFQSGAHMTWSPDGNCLCYLRTLDDGVEVRRKWLYVSDYLYSNPVVLVGDEHGEIDVREGAWSPDSKAIAIGTGKSGILVLEVSR